MCSILGVSRSGYYSWLKVQPLQANDRENQKLARRIKEIFILKRRATYSYSKNFLTVGNTEISVSRKRVFI
ncbi:hypothetical protein [Piscirickettsia salmonis]|uniref:hypothetical protein n=1 Tax=Piscirickettsia salmonis TaxID=1238 RepID=UPI00166249CC|nr:hypothetical protein [Piscirickettsia salmonis]QNR80893.1 hypothetical protein ICC15_02380 [Piscirickettsia salmonis]